MSHVPMPASSRTPTAIDWDAVSLEAISHLKHLLRIDTTNPPGNERPAADYLARILDRAGISYRIVESAPTRASLIARIEGSGAQRPLLLNGHLDVVPADAEHWKYDPFLAEEAEGCIWGRGAIDMKNMVVMSLMTLVLLKRSGASLDRDVIFAAVADEEAGSGLGARYLVQNHAELIDAEYVLNEVGAYTLYFGDKVFYPIQVAEKGICWFELTATGRPGHGSMPRPDNAVVRLARAIDALGRVRLPQHNVPVVEAFLRRLADDAPFAQRKALPLLLQPRLAATLLDVIARQDVDLSASLNAMLRNTVSPTVLSGGKKVNVIPSSATVQVDGRVIPGQSIDDFLQEVQRVVGPDLKINVLERWEGAVFDARTPLFDAIGRTLQRHHAGCEPVPYMIPGFTDSAAYAALGATCYGFSPVRLPPGMPFTQMYHAHNERIPVDGFVWGLRVLFDLVHEFCASR